MNEQIAPNHIGFIVDGNRRWARAKGLKTLEGHKQGYDKVKLIAEAMIDRGSKFVSAYVFSTENWKRAEEEVSYLMDLALKMATRDLDTLIKKDIRIKFLGRRDRLSKKLIKAIEKCEQKSAHCKRATLALCFNYGGQQEISDACKKIIKDGIGEDEITPQAIEERLYAPEVPVADLIVRTSGEQRISNFMLWRSAYSELLFLDKFFPDINKADADIIIEEFSRRNRRFGGN